MEAVSGTAFLVATIVKILVFFVMSVAAAEAAVGLAIVIAIFQNKLTVDVTEINLFRY